MIIEHNGKTIELLGDPHLGRQFVNGVPLHRRGEREKSLWADFERSVLETKADLHICMGDLFDKPFVGYDLIGELVELYRQAPKNTDFWILRGNHDASRDLERRSAFDLLGLALEGVCGNVRLLKSVTASKYWDLVVFPWSPTHTSTELVQVATDQLNAGMIALGHWDVDGHSDNLIPTKSLAERGITRAYTGHVHLPSEFKRDGVHVTVVGSMQPLAHGEDATDERYVTKTLEEVRADPAAFKDKCLRILLEPGEVIDFEIDCLQLGVKREGDETALQVTSDEFDLASLFQQVFDDEGVPDSVRAVIRERYEQRNA